METDDGQDGQGECFRRECVFWSEQADGFLPVQHIDISYHLKIRVLLESDQGQGEEELAIDHWPAIVANIPTRTANGIVREIGWVPELCDRPGAMPIARDFANGSPPPPPHDSTASQARFRIANPSAASPSPSPAPAPVPVAPPQPIEPSPMAGFVPSTRAEEEKLRYYEQATRTRDVLQSSLRDAGSTTCGGSDPDQSMSPTSPASTRLYAEHRPSEDTAQVHTATRVNASSRVLERSSTTVAWSGSEAGGATPVPVVSASPVSAALGRSLTVAEQEKARLYDQATSIARQRQAEARSQAELDEFEQAQDAYERRLILEAEEERRREEERVKAEFEASERARIRAEEEQWRLEEEERRARAEAEREEKKRRAEQALADELRRFEEQRRTQSAQRAAELERQAEERRREDEMKRQRAEEMRRLDEERAAQEEEHRRRERALEPARAAAVAAEQDEQRRRQIALAVAAEEARRRQEEEDHRRRQEEARRQELSEIEQLRAEQQRLLEEREELRRALAARSPHGEPVLLFPSEFLTLRTLTPHRRLHTGHERSGLLGRHHQEHLSESDPEQSTAAAARARLVGRLLRTEHVCRERYRRSVRASDPPAGFDPQRRKGGVFAAAASAYDDEFAAAFCRWTGVSDPNVGWFHRVSFTAREFGVDGVASDIERIQDCSRGEGGGSSPPCC